jgi:hypothetical protein
MKPRPILPAEFTRQLRAYGAPPAGRARATSATKWIGYTTAAGAAFALTPDLEAVPVFGTGPLTVVYTGANGAATVQLNLDGDANNDFRFRILRQTGVNGFGTESRIGRAIGTGLNFNEIRGGSGFTAFRATAGPSFSVGGGPLGFYVVESLRNVRVRHHPNSVVSTVDQNNWPGGPNFGDSDGYLGVRFKDGAAQNHFGWIHISVRNDSESKPNGMKILDWAYESVAGVPLHVPNSVPEVPASAVGLGALALGAAGIQRLRRERKSAATPQ